MARAVLKRATDGCYDIPGHPHLRVEPQYDGRPKRYGWMVIDNRYSPGIDRHDRWMVVLRETLAEVREWVAGGGPNRWEPDRRKTDRAWRP